MSFLCLLLALSAVRAALIPVPNTGFNILNQALPTSSGLLPQVSPSTLSILDQTPLISAGLNPLSLVGTSSTASMGPPNLAVNNVFNGINVALLVSPVPTPPVLASVTSNVNQIFATASGLLQAAMVNILPSSSVLPLPAETSKRSDINQPSSISCIDIFALASQTLGSVPTTLITLQPACSPLSVYVSRLQVSSGFANTPGQISSSLPISLINQLAPTVFNVETSALALDSSPATSASPPLPCTTFQSFNPQRETCSLVPGNVVPRNGLLPCGTCPTKAGLLGIYLCPWLCSISFFGAGAYACSPIDISGQTFPDSGAPNITNHLAEAICHQCAAPYDAAISSIETAGPANAPITSAATLIPATTARNDLSCTNISSSTSRPCCEPYGMRGNLVCSSCPVDPAELAVCPWLCRMPYIEGRIDFECSPIDLSGIDLFSPYNETVQCEKCMAVCSFTDTVASASSGCVLSSTVVVPLTPKVPTLLTAITTVSPVVPTCTNTAPGAPLVTCSGGPDFSTLFCPQGCPTVFTDQCSFFCMSIFGSAFGGMFSTKQCAPVDLSSISPGIVSCQQCSRQCNQNDTGFLAGPSIELSNGAKAPMVSLAASSTTAPLPTCTMVNPNAVDLPASRDSNTGLLFRSSCGIGAATVAQCPYLCSQGGSAFFPECSDTDVSGEEPTGQSPLIVCIQCLPPCLTSSTPPATNASGRFSTMANSLPVGSAGANRSAAVYFSSFPSTFTLPESTSLSPPVSTLVDISSPASVGVTLKPANSTKAGFSATSSSLGSSTEGDPSLLTSSTPITTTLGSSAATSLSRTCASAIPTGIDSPAIFEPNTGLLVRSACGHTEATVNQCPFICSAGGGAPNGNCYTEDITGRLMYGSYPPMVCQQCLPPCATAARSAAGPTCSSVAPNAPDPSPLIDLSGILYRSSCGTSAASTAQCPYLCGLLGSTLISRQCFFQDLTNMTIAGLFADVGSLTCEKCLPPCGDPALPSCTSGLGNGVTSLAGKLTTEALALVSSIEGELSANVLPTSLVANIIAPLPASPLSPPFTLLPAQLPSSVAVSPIFNPIAVVLPISVSWKTTIPTSAAPTVVNSIVAVLPADASLPSLASPLQGEGLFPPILAERALTNAIDKRDVLDAVTEGSSSIQIQLTCSDTTAGVAACPYLCSPMDDNIHPFRRCAAVDITNNFIGVNRVTCERCLPLCANL